jgi:hypothetical protein
MIYQEPVVDSIPHVVDLHEHNSIKTKLMQMFFEFTLEIMSLKRNLFEFEGGQNTNFILVLFKIINFTNFC